MSSSNSPQPTWQRIRVDDFQYACESLVRIICPEHDANRIRRSLNVVWAIVKSFLKEDQDLEEHLADEGEFLDNVENRPGGEQGFIKLLRDMEKDNSWEPLFDDGTVHCSLHVESFGPRHSDHVLCLDVFLKPFSKRSMILAAKRAWISPFRGNAHIVLLETIADLLDQNRYPYARLTNIMNSSGTGKSRMVDELGKTIITVTMCLRSKGTEGFLFCLIFSACLFYDPNRVPSS